CRATATGSKAPGARAASTFIDMRMSTSTALHSSGISAKGRASGSAAARRPARRGEGLPANSAARLAGLSASVIGQFSPPASVTCSSRLIRLSSPGNGARSSITPERRSSASGALAGTAKAAPSWAVTRLSSRAIIRSAEPGNSAGSRSGAVPRPPKVRSTMRSTAAASSETTSGSASSPTPNRALAASAGISSENSISETSRAARALTVRPLPPASGARAGASARANLAAAASRQAMRSACPGPARTSSGQCCASARWATILRSGFTRASSLREERLEIDLVDAAEAFFLGEDLVDRRGQPLLQPLLALERVDVLLGRIGQHVQQGRADRQLVLLEPHQHAPVAPGRAGEADLDQRVRVLEVGGELLREGEVRGLVLAAAVTLDLGPAALAFLAALGLGREGILLALADELGVVVFLDLLVGVPADDPDGEQAIHAAPANPEQDHREGHLEQHAAALLLLVLGFL